MRRFIVLLVFMLASCGGANTPSTATVTSSPEAAFQVKVSIMGSTNNDTGENPQPVPGCWSDTLPIFWENPPANTQSFALLLTGPMDQARPDFTYSLVYNLPATANTLEFSNTYTMDGSDKVYTGIAYNGTVGRSGFGSSLIMSPCAQSLAEPKTATFTVYALDLPPTLEQKLDRTKFEAATQGHVIAKVERTLSFEYIEVKIR